MSDLSPIVRILLRVWVGYMMAQNWIDEEIASWLATDPDIISVSTQLFSFVVWALVEYWWRLAKRFGWAT